VSLYFNAVQEYKIAQHSIFEDDNPEKMFFHERMSACYDGLIALTDYPIERVDVEWEGHQLSGLFHMLPDRAKAPTVLYCPGMDNTKEGFPDPSNNVYRKRGMHILAIDGPGQGVSNLRKIRVTDDNYEHAAKTFIDWLVKRPEVDADRIGVVGTSMGSHWGTRIASADDRVKALATTAACYATKRAIFQMSSPRFKQIFMYMAGIQDEAEFDKMAEKMHLFDHAPHVTCPTLMVTGEYDPLSPLREAYEVFDRVAGPKEFWVVEDEFHSLGRRGIRNFGGLSGQPFLADFVWDAVHGKYEAGHRREVVVRHSTGVGPYEDASPGIWFPERAQESYLP
jgi:pimeloyl-ACP methyl ester carboxylesterase